jgi:hypothetical protein
VRARLRDRVTTLGLPGPVLPGRGARIADMRILAYITAGEPVDAILTHVGLSSAPLLLPRRAAHPRTTSTSTPIRLPFSTKRLYTTRASPSPYFDFDQGAGA